MSWPLLAHQSGLVMRLTLRQQQAEEAQAAAKVKSLITEMSHDLRTPLTTLLLYTEILRHHKYETDGPGRTNIWQRSTRKARQIKQLSDNLFEYALVTRDTVAAAGCRRPASPRSLRSRWPRWWRCCSSAALPVRWSWAARMCSSTVRAQYIRRILDNIGSNLIKYADPARPIEVRFLRQEGRAGPCVPQPCPACAPGSRKAPRWA